MIILTNPTPQPIGDERHKYEWAFHRPAQMYRFIQQHGLNGYTVRTVDVEPLDVIEE